MSAYDEDVILQKVEARAILLKLVGPLDIGTYE